MNTTPNNNGWNPAPNSTYVPNNVPFAPGNSNDISELINLERQSLQKLTSINKWVTFFGILTVIGIIGGIIAGLIVAISMS